jgi:hypothetical protein
MVNIRRPRAPSFRNKNRNNSEVDEHRYQPFARPSKPPQHPNTVKIRRTDSRDDDEIDRRHKSNRDDDDNSGYISDNSTNTLSGRPYRNNDPMTVVKVSLKQSLILQKAKLGIEHPSVTKAIHSLAIEYKMQGKLNKAVLLFREGVDLLDVRLGKEMVQTENETNDDDSRCSAETMLSVVENASGERKAEIVKLLEEKSMFYSCLGNIFRMRRLFREAMDYYVKSCDMLVEAGYSGESKRVAMMVRIMRRTEMERIRKPPVKQNAPAIQRISLVELR